LFIDLFGNTEFAVRAGAFLCWLVTAGFVTRLTRELFGRSIACRALALTALLPAYFFFGFFMSPDAPVTACWAAAIYFMHRALIAGKPNAWFGVGIALGLGMTSKYTIALVGAAFVLFVLFDRQARQWLRRPQPYLALLIALLLFSPPVIWNWQHDWISFAFQSEGRVKSGFSFSLPRLIGNVLVFLTPTGLLAVVALLLQRRRIDWPVLASPVASLSPDQQARSRALLIWLAIFPLAVFTVASLTRVSKLNWTGPLWLALLPLLACLLPGGMEKAAQVAPLPKLAAWCRRAWPPTLVICLLLYGGALHWLSLGLPGVGYPDNLHLLGWRDFGRDIEQRVQYLERQRGEPVLVVGMDRNRIASGLAFYRTMHLAAIGAPSDRPVQGTASEHLFGDVGLMYSLWFPSDKQTGQTMLLVAEKAAQLNTPGVLSRVREAGEIKEVRIWKQGKPAGRYYLRLVTGYHDRVGDRQSGAGDAAED
jgi:dolichol-phosphate mannosyltransferase